MRTCLVILGCASAAFLDSHGDETLFFAGKPTEAEDPLGLVFGGDHIEPARGQARTWQATPKPIYDYSIAWPETLKDRAITDFSFLPCGVNYRGPADQEDNCDMKLRVVSHTIPL